MGGSVDPNDKFGAVGNGSLISSQTWLPYTIQFENLSTALYPAQPVVVSDQLDSDLDPTTVIVGRISFGSHYLDPTPSAHTYSADVPLSTNLSVRVNFTLVGSQLVWSFDTFHPDGQPLQPDEGFLPPNDPETNSGQGSVLFTVRPRGSLIDGTAITNQASLTFDGVTQSTGTWSNIIDNTPPASHVASVAVTPGALSLTVSWVADSSPDVMDYTIAVAEDGGPYRAWRTNTTITTDTLGASSDHHPHNYSFYSVARDQAGNIETAPAGPDVSFSSQVAVGPGRWELSLGGARPNPVRGEIQVSLTLSNQEPAMLELLDVTGRRVLRRDVGSMGPGPHVVTLGASPRLKSGLYFLRLSQNDRSLNARLAVLR